MSQEPQEREYEVEFEITEYHKTKVMGEDAAHAVSVAEQMISEGEMSKLMAEDVDYKVTAIHLGGQKVEIESYLDLRGLGIERLRDTSRPLPYRYKVSMPGVRESYERDLVLQRAEEMLTHTDEDEDEEGNA